MQDLWCSVGDDGLTVRYFYYFIIWHFLKFHSVFFLPSAQNIDLSSNTCWHLSIGKCRPLLGREPRLLHTIHQFLPASRVSHILACSKLFSYLTAHRLWNCEFCSYMGVLSLANLKIWKYFHNQFIKRLHQRWNHWAQDQPGESTWHSRYGRMERWHTTKSETDFAFHSYRNCLVQISFHFQELWCT